MREIGFGNMRRAVDLEFQIVDFLVASDQLVLSCDLVVELGLVPLPYV